MTQENPKVVDLPPPTPEKSDADAARELAVPRELPSIPGMAPERVHDIRLADCCGVASVMPGPHGYQYVQIDGEWYSVVWLKAKAEGKQQGWSITTNPVKFCQDCGRKLDAQTPRRGYHKGRWQPLDAGIESRIAQIGSAE